MQDNVRIGKESLTKKISYHEQHPKKYSTIQSLQKEPTRKNIKLQYPAKHPQVSLNQHKNYPERKLKSLSKHERRQTEVRRWGEGSQPQLSTIDGLLKRNAHHLSKFSLSKQRQGQACKQKYKRSQQIRSVIETKKMSSLNKMERKHTDATVSMTNFYNSISESYQPVSKNKLDLKEPQLDTIINPSDNYEQEPTLEDVLISAVHLLYAYFGKKEEKTSTANTSYLKKKRQNSLTELQVVEQKLRSIMQETGEMSLRTLVVFGIVKYQENKYNDSIMYLTKVLEATDGNLMLIDLPANSKEQIKSQLENTQNKTKSFQLNLHAYIALAESFRVTNNYLCSINALLKWQFYFIPAHKNQQPHLSLKGHYQTLQPNQAESEKEEYKQSQRLKKKSYLLVNLQNDNTINKLKKYSSIQNQSSIEFHQANKKTNLANRPKLDLDDLPSVYASSTINRERLPSEIGSYSQLQYRREITTIYLLLARLYVNIKSFESAANYYKTCLNFNPHKIEAILELASLYYTQKGYKICLQWLQTSIASFEKEKECNDRWELDIGYLRYYRALILLQEGKTDESYRQLCELKVKQLSSEVNYYKGILMMRRLAKDIGQSERNKTIQSILMHFNQSIACYTSQEYLSKSFFQILVILLFEKKDYYGAQYELARFKKMMPTHCQVQQEPYNLLKKQIKIYEDEEVIDPKESRLLSTQRENYFSILSDLTEAVICILKMKITKGLTIIKQIGLRLQGNNQDLLKCFGNYYNQLFKVVLQFKFYSYYILRQYQMSLKHVNKLLEVMAKEEYFCNDNDRKGVREVEIKLLNINRLMLECMILMKQTKFNYAMSKLKEIESMLIQGNGSTEQQAINSGLIVNNFNMVKSLCYINIYSQLEQEKRDSLPFGECAQKEKSKGDSSDENNKEILLSAEQLLRHCLISDKENSLIYYLISIIHFELQSYESSLKYIREALQYSDDHMIKHYFAKANTKALMGRYDEAIKDYTNAVIVFKEQNKNEVVSVQDPKIKANKLKQQQMDEYYQEKQIMIKEIFLNRAIAYLKQAYALGKQSKFIENANLISSYRLKASEDLLKYFTALLDGKIDLSHQREIREKLLLFMHTDDPHQAIQLGKKFIPRLQLLNDQDYIGIYYLTKELNNCISHLKTVIRNLEEKTESKEIEKSKKDSLPAKYKKISMALPKNKVSNNKNVTQRLLRLKLDLRCLQALKRSSSRYQGALEQSLIQLLELTEQIYKQKEVLNSIHKDQQSTITLQELLTSLCGQIFRWSDILFFIGVIHYQLCEYETAIKYFEESYNEKRMSGTLYSLEKYLQPREQVSEQEEQERNQDLEPLFENCVYSKEEMNYNLGLCYLMLKKYKQAYYYLQSYPHFLEIIRKGITDQSNSNDDNQFISESEKPNHGEIFIDDGRSLQSRKSKRISKQIDPKQREFDYSIQDLKDDIDYQSNKQSRLSEESKYPNITPFPIRNRLCSIYTPRTVEKYSFNLSFCLPKIGLPTLSTFYEEQIEMGRVVVEEDDHSISQCSQVERLKDIEQDCNRYKLSRDSFESAVKHLSLLDLEMKPIAPWIRQNINGIIFTENLINESVELNSERADRLKEKAELKEGRKAKKDRYGSEECKE